MKPGEGVVGREMEGAWGDSDAGGMRETGYGAYGTRVRTRNMPYVLVTLDVSRLSGWLNADASC